MLVSTLAIRFSGYPSLVAYCRNEVSGGAVRGSDWWRGVCVIGRQEGSTQKNVCLVLTVERDSDGKKGVLEGSIGEYSFCCNSCSS